MICRGSYTAGVRENPTTGARECQICGKRFDRNQLAGTSINVPGHSPISMELLLEETRQYTGNTA